MLSYAIRRSLSTIPILFLVVTIVFIGVRVIPGNPAIAILGNYASESSIEALTKQMGLDKPIWIQYYDYLKDLSHGNLGRSLVNGKSVTSQVLRVFPFTFFLTAGGIFVGLLVGVPLGVLTAVKRNTLLDYLGRTFSLAGLSAPSYYLGILLILLFALFFNFFPASGGGEVNDPISFLYHLFLPALSLGLLMAAYMTRMSRNSLLDILNEDYVRTGRAKGLPEMVVLYKHALRNAMIPIITLVGLYMSILVGNCVLIETVFTRPGIGKLLIGAVHQRDYTTLQSLMLLYAGFIAFVNLAVDLSYCFINPKVSYD